MKYGFFQMIRASGHDAVVRLDGMPLIMMNVDNKQLKIICQIKFFAAAFVAMKLVFVKNRSPRTIVQKTLRLLATTKKRLAAYRV